MSSHSLDDSPSVVKTCSDVSSPSWEVLPSSTPQRQTTKKWARCSAPASLEPYADLASASLHYLSPLPSFIMLPLNRRSRRPRRDRLQLYPEEIIAAITAPLFLVYSAVCIAAIIALVNLSRTRYGDKWVMIDLGVCALSVSRLRPRVPPLARFGCCRDGTVVKSIFEMVFKLKS